MREARELYEDLRAEPPEDLGYGPTVDERERDFYGGSPIGRQALAVAAASVGLTVPDHGRGARCRLETAEVRFTLDGTVPTTTVGTLLEPGDVLELDGRDTLLQIRFIRTGATSGTLQVEFTD